MKRFHVHVAVTNLETSIAFYSQLFGQAPSKTKFDYAKWMLDEPRVNFAISSRGHAVGVNHFGFQADSPEELAGLKKLAESATGGKILDEGEAACCYANSEKHWTVDPQGLAWEHFYTMADAEVFGSDTVSNSGACCIPLKKSEQDSSQAKVACCLPNENNEKATANSCCG